MKKIIPIMLVAVAVTFGFLYRQQARKAAEKEAQAAAAKRELAEAEAEAQRQEQRAQSEQARLSAANAQLAEKVAKVARSEKVSNTNPSSQGTTADATKPKHPMAEMLRDPDMKEVFRKQARESVARGVKELVSSDLVQRLGLTKEQTVELKKLLTQKGTLGFDFMMPVMTGELDEAGLAELGRKTKADMTALADELKSLLGDENYKAFEAHEKTQPDRDRVEKFAARLKETGQALSPDQRDQLLAAMVEERNNFKFAVDYNDTSQIDYEHFHDFYSEDKMNTYFQEMEQLNDRILQRAQAILPAEQAAELQEVLKLQLQKGKYVVKSTNAMLGKNGRSTLNAQPSTAPMHSPAIALAWEIWRKNRTGHLLILALIPVSVLIFEGLALWIPETRALPGSPSPAWALLLIPMLTSLVWVLNAFTHTEGDSKRGFSGIPTRMFTLPMRTGFLVGCLAIYGIAAVLATYFSWAIIIRGITGFALPLRWPAVSLATSMICFQAAVWGLASFPWIRILVISFGALGIIALNAMLAEAGVSHLDREAILTAVLLSFLPVAIAAAWFGVKSERCGGWRPWGWVRSLWCVFIDVLPRRMRPFRTASAAQFWFEWRRRGFFLSVALAFSIAGGVCLYFPFASITDSGFPVAGAVSMVILPLWFGGLIGIGLAKTDYWSPEVAMQPFQAIRPVTDGELLTAKLRVATGIVALGWAMGLLLILALCTWERWREMWHLDDHVRGLVNWLPSDPGAAVLFVTLAIVAFPLAIWKCVTDSLCLGLTGNRWSIMKHSYIGIGVFVSIVCGGAWLYQYPAHLGKARPLLFLIIGVAFMLKFIGTIRSFVTVMRRRLLPGSTLKVLTGLWLLGAASFSGFVALLAMYSPLPKPLLLLALVWLWPAGELFQSVINLSANRHR